MDEAEQREIETRLKGQIGAYHEAALMFTAISSGLPDLLTLRGPMAVEDMAEELGLEPAPLRRFLRGLVAMKLLEEQADGHFALTPVGAMLAEGSGSSLREKAFVVVGHFWLPWMSLIYSLKNDVPSFPFAFKKTIADWRGRNASEGKFFFRYLAKEEGVNADEFLDALGDLADGTVIASVGGGYAGWLAPALERHPRTHAIVFDTPPILEGAKPLYETAKLLDRVSFAAGDILEETPPEAGVYVLKGVLPQHDDAGVAAILRNVRGRMAPDARLVIHERVMPTLGADDLDAVMLDLHMMTITGGRARTLDEMTALLAEAGLCVTKVTPTSDSLTLIDAKIVGSKPE